MKINVNGQQLMNNKSSLSNGNVEHLERQIQSLQEELSKLDTNNALDPKMKQEKKKQLEEELTNLKQQLAQEQIKQKKSEKEKAKQESIPQMKKAEETESCIMSNQTMNALLSASTTMKQAGAINHARVQMNSSANVLKGEIAVIESRGGNPVDKKRELSELEVKIDNVTGNMIEKYGEANKIMKSSVSGFKNKAEEKKTDEKEESEEKTENPQILNYDANDKTEIKDINIKV